MSEIKTEDLRISLNYLFQETFEGSPKEGSIYLDRGIGVFNTLENIDAAGASASVSNSTIAAQTDHLRYYLDVLNNFLSGTVQTADWGRSWEIKSVNDEQWRTMNDQLRESFESVKKTFAALEFWDQDKISEAFAIVVHTAYHLGAIRQIAKALPETEPLVISVAGNDHIN